MVGWYQKLAGVVAQNFEVNFCWRTGWGKPGRMTDPYGEGLRITFYGVALNSETAAYAYTSIRNQMWELIDGLKIDYSDYEDEPWRWRSKRVFSTDYKLSYIFGVVRGIQGLLWAKKEHEENSRPANSTALVVLYKDVADRMEKEVMKPKVSKRRIREGSDYDAHLRGNADASKISLVEGRVPSQIGG